MFPIFAYFHTIIELCFFTDREPNEELEGIMVSQEVMVAAKSDTNICIVLMFFMIAAFEDVMAICEVARAAALTGERISSPN
jgi:hypothetical protein